ncbi:gfo/Idh/MocA family oxidoreductase [Candidatus Poribacteria bacterium]|nr:gfo/Idh/MocA family oxidoreductase [Candidatus Poribacteria bacterium]
MFLKDNNMNEVRFGIIGCGVIAPTHAAALDKIENARLVAVADIQEDKAKGFADKYEISSYYKEYNELLNNDEVDAVSICTPHYLHSPMAIDAARAGKHVIVEKPMAITMAEADEMIDECKKANVKLGAIFQHRFDPAAQCIKKAIEDGRLGQLVMGGSYTKWYRSNEYYDYGRSWRGILSKGAGGALINQAIHMVDLLRWFMGPVDAMSANISTLTHPIEAEDICVASIKFKNGALGTVEASVSTVPNMPEQLHISGTKGTVVIEGTKLARWDIEDENLKDMQALCFQDVRFQGKSYYGDSHPRQIEDFVLAILEDREPYIDGNKGKDALEVVLGIYESAREGKQVKFD